MTFDKSADALVECQGEADRVAYGFSPFPGPLCPGRFAAQTGKELAKLKYVLEEGS